MLKCSGEEERSPQPIMDGPDPLASLMPLLKFPLLAFTEILRICDFQDLFHLSIINKSPKIRSLVKRALTAHNFSMQLEVNRENEIFIKMHGSRGIAYWMLLNTVPVAKFYGAKELRTECIDIGNRQEKMFIGIKPLFLPYIHTQEPIECFRNLMTIFNEMGINSVAINFNSNYHPFISTAFDLIEQFNWKLTSAEINCETVPEELIRRAYQHSLHFCEELKLLSVGNFLTSPPVPPPIDTPSRLTWFYVNTPAQWFTIEHLLTIKNCKSIQMTENPITYEEFNGVLKQWKAGEARFERLAMKLANGDSEVLLDGLDALFFIPDRNQRWPKTGIGRPETYLGGMNEVHYKLRRDERTNAILTVAGNGWVRFFVEEYRPVLKGQIYVKSSRHNEPEHVEYAPPYDSPWCLWRIINEE